MSITPEQVEQLTKDLTDKGCLIEAGWISLSKIAYPNITKDQYESLRQVFFAGAQHLFASIMTVLDPGSDISEVDLARMEAIDEELKGFIENFKLQYLTPAKGNS